MSRRTLLCQGSTPNSSAVRTSLRFSLALLLPLSAEYLLGQVSWSQAGKNLARLWFTRDPGICAAGRKYLSGTDKFLMCWFTLCGFIHLVVEGASSTNVPSGAIGDADQGSQCRHRGDQLQFL
jgi:hypothetical protein